MYRIIRNRKNWYILSSVLIVLSLFSIIFIGLRVGVDYKGGSILELQSSNDNFDEIVESALKDSNVTNYQIKNSDSDVVNIRMGEITNEVKESIVKEISSQAPDVKELSFDNIGPTVGNNLRNKSIYAIIIASIAIIIFIAYSFRKIPKPLSSWKFGSLAVIALIHDIIITIGFVSIMGYFFVWMEVDILFITALLTIMGFSVHDTIVIYDRLRENFIRNRHKNMELIAEESVNQTLARSINTSITTIIVLLALALLGADSVKHFILTLIFGITIGTYSSIFLATPLIISWHKNINKSS